MVRQFGLEHSVIFTGFQKNIPEIMQSMDILVYAVARGDLRTGRRSEAMAMKTPIVISKGGKLHRNRR